MGEEWVDNGFGKLHRVFNTFHLETSRKHLNLVIDIRLVGLDD